MKRNFDFIINIDEGFDKKVLRFYPKQSKVHGFDDEPPTTWKGVYKTYLTYSVLLYEECWDNEGFYETPQEIFSYYRDEGEGLLDLREVLYLIIHNDDKTEYNIKPLGYGIDWEIIQDKNKKDTYVFTMINSEIGLCYRFKLNLDEIKEFYSVLDEFLEYMLKHSVGI